MKIKILFFSKFVFFMKSVISQCLQKGKWTSESKVIDFQTLKLFSEIGNWCTNDFKFTALPLASSLLPKHTQILLSHLSPAPPTNLQTNWQQLTPVSPQQAVDRRRKWQCVCCCFSPDSAADQAAGGGGEHLTECSVDGLSPPQMEFFWSFLSTMWKFNNKMILGRLHLLGGRH